MKINAIAIGSDHAGYDLKESIKKMLKEDGFTIIDCGCDSNESCDYPDYAHAVSLEVIAQPHTYGILICGSANGVCMVANKHKGIRAAVCWNEELAQLARQHNDANIIGLPARFIDLPTTVDIVHEFLKTEFEGGRHLNRINKIDSE